MDRALVVAYRIDGIEWLIAEAGRLAAGVGADLVVLHVRTEDDYEEDRRAIEDVPDIESASYDVDQATEGAGQVAADLASEALTDVDVEYEAVGAIGEEADRILGTAEEYDCDHVFLAGRRRSPTGKAIFGDTGQHVILNFAGPVTIVTHPLEDL